MPWCSGYSSSGVSYYSYVSSCAECGTGKCVSDAEKGGGPNITGGKVDLNFSGDNINDTAGTVWGSFGDASGGAGGGGAGSNVPRTGGGQPAGGGNYNYDAATYAQGFGQGMAGANPNTSYGGWEQQYPGLGAGVNSPTPGARNWNEFNTSNAWTSPTPGYTPAQSVPYTNAARPATNAAQPGGNMVPITYGQPGVGTPMPGYSNATTYATPTRVGGDIWGSNINQAGPQGAAANAAATNPQIGAAPNELYSAFQDLTGNPLSLRSSPLYQASRRQALQATDRMLAASRMSKSSNAAYARAGAEQDVMSQVLGQLGSTYGAGSQQEFQNWQQPQQLALNDQALRLSAVLGQGQLGNAANANILQAQKADIARAVGATGAPVLGQLGIGPNSLNAYNQGNYYG